MGWLSHGLGAVLLLHCASTWGLISDPELSLCPNKNIYVAFGGYDLETGSKVVCITRQRKSFIGTI